MQSSPYVSECTRENIESLTQCCLANTETNNQRLHFPRYFVTSLSLFCVIHSAYVVLTTLMCRVYLHHERNATLTDKDRQ